MSPSSHLCATYNDVQLPGNARTDSRGGTGNPRLRWVDGGDGTDADPGSTRVDRVRGPDGRADPGQWSGPESRAGRPGRPLPMGYGQSGAALRPYPRSPARLSPAG